MLISVLVGTWYCQYYIAPPPPPPPLTPSKLTCTYHHISAAVDSAEMTLAITGEEYLDVLCILTFMYTFLTLNISDIKYQNLYTYRV